MKCFCRFFSYNYASIKFLIFVLESSRDLEDGVPFEVFHTQ